MRTITPLFEKYETIKNQISDYRISYFSPNNTISIANEKLQAVILYFDDNGNYRDCFYKENLFNTGKGQPFNDVAFSIPDDLKEIKGRIENNADLTGIAKVYVNEVTEKPVEEIVKESKIENTSLYGEKNINDSYNESDYEPELPDLE